MVTDQSKTNKKRFRLLKKPTLSMFKKKRLVFLFSILFPIITSTVITVIVVSPLYHYDPSKDRIYNVRSSIRVEHWVGEPEYILMGLDDCYVSDQNFMTKGFYSFSNNSNGLNATFHHIYLITLVPSEAYKYFWEIQITWIIDGTENTIKKSSGSFLFNGFDYISEIDITQAMNKLNNVPQKVELTVTMYSR